jgi:uncharacterized membrane protein
VKKQHVIQSVIVASFAFATCAQAGPPPRYRVVEVESPLASDPRCLPGHAIRVVGGGVSDNGLVPGHADCYSNLEVAPGVVLPYRGAVSMPFAWTRAGGGYEVPTSPDTTSTYLFSVDAAGSVYGWQGAQNGLEGVRWTPAGGFETVITRAPDCFINVSLASSGNSAGSVAGLAFRQDGVAEVPTEFSCTLRWVFRDINGVEIVGPLANQVPVRMNQRNVVVGQVDGSAVKWAPLSGGLTTLDQATPGFISSAYGINNRSIVVGLTGVVDAEFPGLCWSDAVPTLWGRDDAGRTLPTLPRTSSGEAWSINDAGDIVGFSSAGANSCAARSWEAGRATLWRNGRAHDLNNLLVGRPGVTITNAGFINARGQIMAYGYRTSDPPKSCPEIVFPQDGSTPYSVPGECRDQRVYLLTPEDCEE